MPHRHPPAVIIGAGIGGLTLALLLRQRGIAAEVLERSAELREVGAAIGLAANATRVLQRLGLGDGLAQVSTEPTRLIHRDGRDGRAALDAQWYRDTFGAPFFGMHRMAWQRVLADALGPSICTSAAARKVSRRPVRECACAVRRGPPSRPAWW